MPRLLTPGLVEQDEFEIAAHHHRHARRVHHDVAVFDFDHRLGRGFDRGLLGTALRRPADMEGAHRQLGPGLTDRLRGDDADRLANIDYRPAREIAAVAFAAHSDP